MKGVMTIFKELIDCVTPVCWFLFEPSLPSNVKNPNIWLSIIRPPELGQLERPHLTGVAVVVFRRFLAAGIR